MSTLVRRSSGLRGQWLRSLSTSKPILPKSMALDQYNVKYIDVRPARAIEAQPMPTVVLLHGAPGSYNDFKHLIPLLQDRARVVAINLPQFGDLHVTQTTDRFKAVYADTVAEAAYRAIIEICRDDPYVFVAGHSFGGHAAINVVSAANKERSVNVKGMALLASAGHRPHKTLFPQTFKIMTWFIESKIPFISKAAMSFAHWNYVNIIGFPRSLPRNYYISALLRKNSTNYDAVIKQLEGLSHIPSFVAWSKRDGHIEEEIALNLSRLSGAGPRVSFVGGGHNIQKTRAPALAHELLSWMEDVVAGREQTYNKDPVVID
ncbi:hypothetical protein Poli38472_014116 [Pythium oligandrum]|uniref:AB hydrolase-1 domain-containing protein n=1 Tax=Pythium oligandrum TaxID=41045 RepID=A0A8K1CNM8_PYTOL|nr:hypothetical protein Poli38472_014116 [Pythium oligandrum]|eukprot:TMW66804.1 hypothetical protein Poli38472_014116 [Pythium oligandrum]